MAAYSRMRIKPIMSLDRELQMSSDSRWAPIASLRISRLGSAAMAPPEGPPARSGEAAGCLCVKRAHPHSRTQIVGKKRRRYLRAASRKSVRQHGTNDPFGWISEGPVSGANPQVRTLSLRLGLAAGNGQLSDAGRGKRTLGGTH
jgi:hypothetical protein